MAMINSRIFATLPVFVLCLLLQACGGGDSGSNTAGVNSRSYAMGFTDFPYALTIEALNNTYAVLAQDADMAVMHFDDGIPWQEALDGVNNQTSYLQNYPTDLLNSISYKKSSIATGHVVYLAVTPLNTLRDGLAPHRGNAANEALTAPWNAYALDDPHVVSAYIAHCENMIDAFQPDYFAYAIEANILRSAAPSKWQAFVNLAQQTYTSIKANHPDLPVFVSLQAGFFHQNETDQTTAIQQLLPYTDFIAISAYPYTEDSDPHNLPIDYFSSLAALAPTKPFAIAETAWPAEDVTDVNNPSVVLIPASTAMQQAYLQRLLADADTLHARFVNWFFIRDYDDLWDSTLKTQPNAALLRLWKDTGLFDGAGNARPALDVWRSALARPLQ